MRLSLALFVAILALSEARRFYQSDDSSHEADARNRNHADKQLSADAYGHKSLREHKVASAAKRHRDADEHKKFVEGPNGYAASESSNLDQAAASSDSQSSLELVQGPDGFSKRQSSDDDSSSSSAKKSHNSKIIVDGEGGAYGGAAGFGGYGAGYGAGQFGGRYGSSGSQSGSEYGAGQLGDQLGQYGSEAGYRQSGNGAGQFSGEIEQEEQGGLIPRPLPQGARHQPYHQRPEGEHNPVHAGNEGHGPHPHNCGAQGHPVRQGNDDRHPHRGPKISPKSPRHSNPLIIAPAPESQRVRPSANQVGQQLGDEPRVQVLPRQRPNIVIISPPESQPRPRIGTVIVGPKVASGSQGQAQARVFDGTQVSGPRAQYQPFVSVPVRRGGYSAYDESDDSSANAKKHDHSKSELIKGRNGYKKASSLDRANQAQASKAHKKSQVRADAYGNYAKSAEESGSNAAARNHVNANNLEVAGPYGYLKKNELDEGSASRANKFDKKSNLVRNADGSFSSSEEDDSSSASQEKSHKAKSIVVQDNGYHRFY
ncbi:unnamed protein product [Bursaphelenchus xylophilus]|uniref:(pine wood nematode) hypothetical protein n=1 Tax=Bursaphelenchus xylophilus TaxID=6326 RepID=A0A1I7SDM0_BURXY|nr:unnamed protein product [Bursaphelenchus xylophilus]CAG9120862.1 unnamed protein product [Bursaphelenchus xylophilus]